MKICYRCGIDFDGSAFIDGAPCIDCQEAVGGSWSRFNSGRGAITLEEWNRRANAVRALVAKNYTNGQIAEELGFSSRRVAERWRSRLGLPSAKNVGGSAHWKHPERQAEIAARNGRVGHMNRKLGITDSQIGAKLGIGRETVKGMRRKGIDVVALAGGPNVTHSLTGSDFQNSPFQRDSKIVEALYGATHV